MIYATIAGNVGKDAALRNAGGTQVLGFSVAAQSGFGDRAQTIWVNCSVWGARGEKLAQYITKGTPVTVIGEISTREYEGKMYIECRVSEIKLQGKAAAGQQQAAASPAQPASPAAASPAAPESVFDDDVPF